jgi:hypothetical protein
VERQARLAHLAEWEAMLDAACIAHDGDLRPDLAFQAEDGDLGLSRRERRRRDDRRLPDVASPVGGAAQGPLDPG